MGMFSKLKGNRWSITIHQRPQAQCSKLMFYIKKIPEGYWQKEQMFVLPNKFSVQTFIRNLSSLYLITSKSKDFQNIKFTEEGKKNPYMRFCIPQLASSNI